MINILKKLSYKLDKSTNPFIIVISLFFLFLGKIWIGIKNDQKIKPFTNFYGDKEYWIDGQLRAKICKNGDKFYYHNRLKHRDNVLPAVELANGCKFWYQNGKYHRETGPAIELLDGIKEWYINGQQYTEEEYNKKIEELYEPEIKIYIDKLYTSCLEDWDERFEEIKNKSNLNYRV
jgi:hypothetical protein